MNGQAPEEPFSPSDFASLLEFFRSKDITSRSVRNSDELRRHQDRATQLFSRDYHISLIDNREGQYCISYPLDIVVLEAEKEHGTEGDGKEAAAAAARRPIEKVNDGAVLKDYFHRSRFSRAHGRFVIPVILYGRKNICRSATLSHHMESLFNNVHAKTREVLSTFTGWPWGSSSSNSNSGSTAPSPPSSRSTTASAATALLTAEQKATEITLDVEAHRNADEALLMLLQTRYICDLMVEKRKKLLGMSITSSEKAELDRYAKFTISSIPYPGCEFFRVYKQNGHCGINLHYDWPESLVNAELNLGIPASSPQVGWNDVVLNLVFSVPFSHFFFLRL